MIQSISITPRNTILISGVITSPFNQAVLIAPAPADRITSYSGSLLPFPCSEVAFDRTPNQLKIQPSTPSFETEFIYPNSFYLPNGRDVVKPSIFLVLDGKVVDVKELEPLLNVRTLNYRYATSGMDKNLFYSYKDFAIPVGSADNVMRDYKRMKLSKDVA